MEDLQAGCRYSMATKCKNNKSVIFVKLTDSALQSIETFLKSKDVSSTKPTILFKDDNNGILSLPINGEKHNYGFSVSNIETDGLQSGFQCLQHTKNKSLESLGFISKKLQVHATEDSYEKTKSKMTAADQEQKNVCTKELRINLTPLTNNVSTKHSVYVPGVPQPSDTNSKPGQSNLKTRTTYSVPLLQQPIRERIIHILAAKECKKGELLLRLKKEGISNKHRARINVILEEVAKQKGNTLSLENKFWNEVQEDWEFYSKEELQTVKKKKQEFLMSKDVNGVEGLLTRPTKQENGSSSVLYAEVNNQNQNVFYNGAEKDNTNQNETCVPKNYALTNGSTMHSEKNSFHFQNLNGNYNNSNAKKRGRPRKVRFKEDVLDFYTSMSSNGTSQAQKGKCAAIGKLPPLKTSFVSEELQTERVRVNNEKSSCTETITNGYDSDGDENGPSNLMTHNTVSVPVQKPKKRRNVPETQVQQFNNCSDLESRRQYYHEKLLHYKQLLEAYSPPTYHDMTSTGHKKNVNGSGTASASRSVKDTVNGSKTASASQSVKDTVNGSETASALQSEEEFYFPEIQRKYTKVESSEQRNEYIKEYNSEIEDYNKLKFEMKEISDKFTDLLDKLKAFEVGSPEYKKIKLEIDSEYNKAMANSYDDSRRKFEFLRAKLLHMKELIDAYDQEETFKLS